MTTKELLEKAAKAAGIEVFFNEFGFCQVSSNVPSAGPRFWNPLENDGDAFRLAVKLRIGVEFIDDWPVLGDAVECLFQGKTVTYPLGDEPERMTRRAIVMSAAAIAEGRE